MEMEPEVLGRVQIMKAPECHAQKVSISTQFCQKQAEDMTPRANI